jgi:hypothetical protein
VLSVLYKIIGFFCCFFFQNEERVVESEESEICDVSSKFTQVITPWGKNEVTNGGLIIFIGKKKINNLEPLGRPGEHHG